MLFVPASNHFIKTKLYNKCLSQKPKESWNFNLTSVLKISYDGFKSLLLFLNVKTQDT